MSELELHKRRFARERAARKEAEALLEQKSREVFEANQQLRELAEHNRAIVETAAEGIITYDAEGTIRSLNRAAKRMFRCESNAVEKIQALFTASRDADVALFPRLCETLTDELESTDGFTSAEEPKEIIAIRSTGETFPAEVATSVVEDGDSNLYTALIRDLSRRKQLESRLSQVQKMESVGQLAAGIAHEINTPIQFIAYNVEFLQGAFNDFSTVLDMHAELVEMIQRNEDTTAMVERIARQCNLVDLPFLREEFPGAIEQTLEGAKRVTKIVKAMKEFSQPSSASKTSVDINRAIENTIAVTKNSYKDAATIEVDLDPNLGSITCLNAEINQAIFNILSNSAEAISASKQETKGQIRISTRACGEEVEIRVEDNGPGIPDEIQSRIFDPFFTTKEVGEGMGQGLAFVYDLIVNRHNGSIYAISPPSGGATFVVRLPRYSQQQNERQGHANSFD